MEFQNQYQVNFLPWRQQKIIKKKQTVTIFSIAAFCSVSIAGFFLILFQHIEIEKKQITNHSHQQKHHNIQQIKQKTITQKKHLDKLLAQKNHLDNVMRNNQFLLLVLQNLPSATPSKSWLTAFQYIDNKIEIRASSYDFQNVSSLQFTFEKLQGIGDIKVKKLSRINKLTFLHLTAKYQGEPDE
ncbi:PilN domain-containing protein [Providencia sp. Me31A]|uniref:PilN domain-containing protein n=1 Tax=Providencia sp. Me31A TaxID=3392637 RepID=UPI003D2AD9D4